MVLDSLSWTAGCQKSTLRLGGLGDPGILMWTENLPSCDRLAVFKAAQHSEQLLGGSGLLTEMRLWQVNIVPEVSAGPREGISVHPNHPSSAAALTGNSGVLLILPLPRGFLCV